MSTVDPFQEIQSEEDEKDLLEDERAKFRPEEDCTYRVSFAWWQMTKDDNGNPVFKMDANMPRVLRAPIIYKDGVGYVVSQGPKWEEILGDAEDRMGTVIISWPVFRSGPNVGKTDVELFKIGRFDVLPWVFSKSKYQQFKRTHNMKHVGKFDVQITCTNGKFQHLDWGSYDDNYLLKIMKSEPRLFAQIQERVERVAKRLRPLMGNVYSLAELREKMGDASPEPPVEEFAMESEEEFDSLLGNISFGGDDSGEDSSDEG